MDSRQGEEDDGAEEEEVVTLIGKPSALRKLLERSTRSESK
jgi:hypothetical protein